MHDLALDSARLDAELAGELSATPMTDIPQITTDRLLLRGFEPRDVEPYIALLADPDVARFLADGRALTRVEAWRQLAMILGHWMLKGYGLWAVEERATGRLIGRIGCHDPEGWPAFEVGYVLARDAWGKGYAREGAAAALAYGRDTLRRDEIISIIRPANVGSIRVATALGAVAAETIEFFGAPAVLYRYPRRSGATG